MDFLCEDPLLSLLQRLRPVREVWNRFVSRRMRLTRPGEIST